MEDNQALCSVIVPIYNVEKYLERCIQSILDQDYKNIEVILINDGSTDRSGEICRKYKEIDNRIVLIEQENGGMSSARNAGLDAAKGEYIFFVDSDDYVSSSFVSFALEDFIRNESDIVVFGYKGVHVSTGKEDIHRAKASRMLDKPEAMRAMLIDDYINCQPWNKAYKHELFDGVRYPLGKCFEDVGTTYLLFHKADRIYIDSRITYFYQLRENSISSRWWNSERKIKDFFEVRYNQLIFYKEHYPQLVKDAYATTAFVAVMGHAFLKDEYGEIEGFLHCDKKRILDSSFPYSILFHVFYLMPVFSSKVIKMIFR